MELVTGGELSEEIIIGDVIRGFGMDGLDEGKDFRKKNFDFFFIFKFFPKIKPTPNFIPHQV